MLEIIILLPFLTGIISLFVKPVKGRFIIVLTGAIELILTCISLWSDYIQPASNFFSVSPIGGYILLITVFLFFIVSLYAIPYLNESNIRHENIFHGCFLFFLGAMAMVCLSDHLIVIWIAIETTTLASAPLILLHHSKGSLEATWKYIMICSVGIAFALLGTFFIIHAIDRPVGNIIFSFSYLKSITNHINVTWVKAGFIFILIGYGTKMGLAPMHTWLPDSHSEAPAPVSALLSGALLNCAFIGIFKFYGLLCHFGLGKWAGDLFSGFGLFSMIIAGFFIFQQNNYKRLLAYSSIENMGVIALGVGVGGLAGFGALIHLLHHSLIKSSLFLSAGNILLSYNGKNADQIGDMPKLTPKTLLGFGSGFVGISGFPPFGIFLSELLIVIGLFQKGRFIFASLFIISIILVFSGASRTFIRMCFSQNNSNMQISETWARTIPPLILLVISLTFCLWLPQPLNDLIKSITIQ